MKLFKIQFLLVCSLLFLFSCDDDNAVAALDSSQPTGSFLASQSGILVAENMTPTTGGLAIGTDVDGDNFLEFGTDFTTNLGTGTVTVYFSTSKTFTASPSTGNPDLQLVGIIQQAGQSYIKLSGAVDSKFTHVILWCGSANIPFGYAELK